MAAGSRLPPFTAPHLDDFEAYLGEIYLKQTNTPVPVVAGPLRPIIEKCLRPNPDERYGTFGELRQAVEPIFKQRGELVMEISTAGVQTMGYWLNRGISLQLLGRERDVF
jgi:hypothetical protein